jgi:DNA-binding NtrC family response regulator
MVMEEKPLILIVDSDISNLIYCKKILESNDFSVITAQHSENALNIYRQLQNYIYAILLNLQLSGETYFFSIPAIFAINKNAKIIGMSDILEKAELSQYYQTKLFDFIQKPVQKGILIKCLEKTLEIKS